MGLLGWFLLWELLLQKEIFFPKFFIAHVNIQAVNILKFCCLKIEKENSVFVWTAEQNDFKFGMGLHIINPGRPVKHEGYPATGST